MPRQARQGSGSGWFHVIVRGNGKQILFNDAADRWKYLKLLERFCAETEVGVCAYCLMENHVHLLLRDRDGAVSLMMKKLGVTYAMYFNKKYDRTGHLFQDRFLSEAVENDEYFLTVFRYILRNPTKAGISLPQMYPWSSYSLYGQEDSFVDTSLAQELIGDRRRYEEFILSGEDGEDCLDYTGRQRDDEWAKNVIRKKLSVENPLELQEYSIARRNEALRVLLSAGLTVRQIERLTGISRGVIQKV